jgi:fatty acid desaturase
VWPFWAFPFWKALAFATIPSLVLSELFLLFTQVNHVTDENLAAGDDPSSDWYEVQVRTSCSYATDSYLAFLVSGGLHHLLPGVNHYHLFRLAPEIQRICAKHGVPYHSYASFGDALRAHFRCMRRLSEKPEQRDV